MRIDRPPYWYWQLDRWNILATVVLLGAVIITAVTGAGAPAPGLVTPTITQPTAGAALDYAAPGAIAGRAAPGALVRVYDGDTLLGETTADQAGYYRFSLPILDPGPHTLTTRVYDAKGNLIATSEPITVNVVGGPAVQATPTPITPKPTVAPPTFTGLTEGGQLPAGKPGELSGTAAPGTKIQVFDGDKLLGETTAGPDGTWRLTLPALTEGAHTLTAKAISPDGTVLAASQPLKVTAVTVAPPTFTGLTEGGQLPAGKPGELSGTATPGTKIQVFDGDKLLGETIAGPDGTWRLTLPALAEGAHTLTARAVGPDGNVLATSAPITVQAAPPTATPQPTSTAAGTPTATPQPALTATGTPTATPQPMLTATGTPTAIPQPTLTATGTLTATPQPTPTATGTSTVTPAPTAAARPTATLVPGAEVATLMAGSPISLSGTAGPGVKLRIYDGETLIGETVADTDGRWQLTLPPLAVGQHVLTARVYDATGRLISASTPLYVNIVSAAALTPGIATPVASATPTSGVAAVGTPGAPGAPGGPPEITSPKPGAQLPSTAPGVLEGTAAPGSTIRIYDGDKLIAEVVADAKGAWRVVLPALSEGLHILTVREVTADGTEQIGGTPLTITIVPGPTMTPLARPTTAPFVVSPPSGATVRSSQPLLSGRAAPRSTVRIYEGDVLLGETQADATGRWYFVPPIALTVGKHTLRVMSVGADGKEILAGVYELTVAPGAAGLKPLVFVPSSGKAPSGIGILQGVVSPNLVVSVYEGETLLAKVLADEKGQWQYPLPARTPAGQHKYRIVAATKDGVTIYQSELITVTVG